MPQPISIAKVPNLIHFPASKGVRASIQTVEDKAVRHIIRDVTAMFDTGSSELMLRLLQLTIGSSIRRELRDYLKDTVKASAEGKDTHPAHRKYVRSGKYIGKFHKRVAAAH